MIIFPLSIPGKIVLILIAIIIGLIFWGMMRPEMFRKWFGQKKYEQMEKKINEKTEKKNGK